MAARTFGLLGLDGLDCVVAPTSDRPQLAQYWSSGNVAAPHVGQNRKLVNLVGSDLPEIPQHSHRSTRCYVWRCQCRDC